MSVNLNTDFRTNIIENLNTVSIIKSLAVIPLALDIIKGVFKTDQPTWGAICAGTIIVCVNASGTLPTPISHFINVYAIHHVVKHLIQFCCTSTSLDRRHRMITDICAATGYTVYIVLVSSTPQNYMVKWLGCAALSLAIDRIKNGPFTAIPKKTERAKIRVFNPGVILASKESVFLRYPRKKETNCSAAAADGSSGELENENSGYTSDEENSDSIVKRFSKTDSGIESSAPTSPSALNSGLVSLFALSPTDANSGLEADFEEFQLNNPPPTPVGTPR